MVNIHRTNLLFAILAVFCGNSCSVEGGFAQETTDWLVSTKLTKAAQTQAVSVDWQGAPLRQRLGSLSRRQRASVFLDRRVDGSQTVDFSVSNVSLEECLWRLCDQLELGLCRVDDVYYVGPRVAAANLIQQVAALKETVDGADRASRRRWERAETLTVQRLAEPRMLVQTVCDSIGVSLLDADAIPHDLWEQTHLPPTEAATKLSLLLVGFGKSFESNIGLDQLSLVDFPNPELVTRVFQLGENAKAGARLIEDKMPDVQIETNSRSLKVTTSADKSLRVHRLLVSMQKPEIADLSRQVFTLTTVNKRGTILATIANQIDREFSFEPEQVELLNQRIELDLVNAPVEQVIAAALAGSGLEYRITAEALEILGGSPDDE